MAENIFKRMGQIWDHFVNGKQGDNASSSKPFYVDPMKPINLMSSNEDSETDAWMDEQMESSSKFTDPIYSSLPGNIFNTYND